MKSKKGRSLLWSVVVWGGLISAPAYAGDEKDDDCKEEILESGEKACVRTRVVSRRVVKRSKPTRKKRRKRARKRKSRLVVNPSAHSRKVAHRTQKTSSQPARAVAAPVARPAAIKSLQPSVKRADTVQEPDSPDSPRASFRVEAVTDVPVLVGAGVLFETRSRFRLRSSLGVMPQGYLSLSNSVLRRVNEEYPEEAELLLAQALDDSITWKSQIGVRPFRRAGFYVHAGYTLLGFRGDATGEELVSAAEALDQDQGELMRRMNPSTVTLNSRLHMVNMELGWDFELGRRANLRLGAGWSYTFTSKTRIDATFEESSEMDAEEIALFEEVSGKYMDAIYRQFVHPPSVSLAFGVRF